jgi:4-hydroxybenzoate polyprenyltransferase
MVKKIQHFLESLDFSPLHIIGIISSLAFLRLFLENFSSPEATGMFSPVVGIISYASLYGMLLIFFTLLVAPLIKKSLLWTARVITVSFSIVLLTPIIDLVLSGGQGFCIAYVQDTGRSLLQHFVTFLLPHAESCGITPGLRIQVLLGVIGVAGLVWIMTRSWIKTFIGAIGAYIITFIGATFPILVSSLVSTYGNNNFYHDALASLLTTIHYPSSSIFFEVISSNITTVLIARIALLLVILGIGIIWFFNDRISWKGWWLGSLRKIPLAGIHLLFLTFGLLLGFGSGSYHLLWPDWIAIILLYLSLFFTCWNVGAINDIEDVAIDTISNPERPMIRYHLSKETMQTIQHVSGIFALTAAILVNYNVFFSIAFFIIAYTIHSSFIRLKRIWIGSSILISLSGVSAFIAGYLTLSPDQIVAHLPLSVPLMIMGILLPYSIIKDVPDIKGDTEGSIHTLPVTFGIPISLSIVLILIAGWFWLFHSIIPWFFSLPVIISILLFFIKRSWVHEKIKVLGIPILLAWMSILIQIFFLVYN